MSPMALMAESASPRKPKLENSPEPWPPSPSAVAKQVFEVKDHDVLPKNQIIKCS